MRLPLFALSTVLLTTASLQAAPANKALTKKFARLDLNGDELLDRSEFAKILPAKQTRNGALAQTQEAMFIWFDEDANEGIDLGEWMEGKTSNGAGSPDFTDEIRDELDANGNGKLEWKEFSRVIGCYVPSKTAKSWHLALTTGGSTGASISAGISNVNSFTTDLNATLNWMTSSSRLDSRDLDGANLNRLSGEYTLLNNTTHLLSDGDLELFSGTLDLVTLTSDESGAFTLIATGTTVDSSGDPTLTPTDSN